MKTKIIFIFLAATSSILLFNACNKTLQNEAEVFQMADKSGVTDYQYYDTCTYDGVLTETEIEGLKFMAEEEKMAHDVYVAFYELYDYALFNNIANSEASHTNAVMSLLEGYNIEFQISDALGQFSNSDIQNLYNALIEKGQASLEEALATGALIEETDIADLVGQLEIVVNEDVVHVYSNLLKGSENHLRAFTSSLSVMGITYSAQILDDSTFTTILESTNSNRKGSNQGMGDKLGMGTQGAQGSNGLAQGTYGSNGVGTYSDGIVCDSTGTPLNLGGSNQYGSSNGNRRN